MEEVNLRFQHISEEIFKCLDNESLTICQEVGRNWNVFLEGQKFFQARTILETVKKKQKVGKSWFEVLKKCNTTTIMALRIAVEHFDMEPLRCKDISPLHVAAEFGQLTLFNEILQKVEIKFPLDGFGRSILDFAAEKDQLHIYESIVTINRYICPHSIIDFTLTSLDTAVFWNSLKVCQYIIENNPHIAWDKTISGSGRLTPFHIAALEGHTEIYKIIMEKFADKNPKGIWGMTPLHLAAHWGNLALCRLILENIQNKSPVTNCGKTPKDMAEAGNHNEVVKLFP